MVRIQFCSHIVYQKKREDSWQWTSLTTLEFCPKNERQILFAFIQFWLVDSVTSRVMGTEGNRRNFMFDSPGNIFWTARVAVDSLSPPKKKHAPQKILEKKKNNRLTLQSESVSWVLRDKLDAHVPLGRCAPGRSGKRLCVFPIFFFGMLPHSQRAKYIRNAHRWCAVIREPGSAWLEGTLTMDLKRRGIPTHV